MFNIAWCFVFIGGLGGWCGLCCIRGGVFWDVLGGRRCYVELAGIVRDIVVLRRKGEA